MKLVLVSCATICLLVAFVSGAEESADPSITSGDVKVSNLDQDNHGPLMAALLTGEGTGTLNRQKRTGSKRFYPKYGGYGGGGGGGGCCSSCGGGCGGGGGSGGHSSASAEAKAQASSYASGGGYRKK